MTGMTDPSVRDNAFSATLGEDYRLLKFSYPHHDDFQAAAAEHVRQHFAAREVDTIRVLEGGAGSGVTTSFLLAADQRLHIYAVDSASAMLEQAATLLAAETQRVELLESDLLEYVRQQPDESFDAFVAVWTLHNLRPGYRAKLFGEIRRVLRHGGLFVSGDKYTVSDITRHYEQLEVQLDRFRAFPASSESVAQAWVDHNLEDESIRISEEEQRAVLENLGFTDVRTVYRQDMEAIITAVARPGTVNQRDGRE